MMQDRKNHRLFALLGLFCTALIGGCEVGTIEDQARSSLSSFVTGVVTTTINNVINGDN